jgi:hypothetical protein
LDEHPEGQSSGASLLELVESKRINVSGCQLLDAAPYAVDAKDCSDVSITGCTIHDTRKQKQSRHAIRFTGVGRGNLIAMNTIGATKESPLAVEKSAGVTVEGNVVQA